MKKCLIFLESQYEKYCVDLLKTAEEMYGDDYYSCALRLDADTEQAGQEFDEIITIEDERIRVYDMRAMAEVIEELHQKYSFASILILATHIGRMLAPALAMRMRTGLVADVTGIGHFQDEIEMIRPAFSGKIMAGIINTGGSTVMMSVRPGIFLYENKNKKHPKVWNYRPQQFYASSVVRISRQENSVSEDIRESEILVSGGGGILNDFDSIDRLTKRLGAMKSASRKVVDKGKADRSIQVGQSGKIVHPKLYIALGISGVLQHVAGLNRVKHIIAVNTNKDAPLCSMADIVVEGDARTFIERLIERIDHET